jgi:predicted MFS family arabinose efflux permease
LFLVGALADLLLRRLRPEVSLPIALVLIPIGLVLLMRGVTRPSLWFFLVGTAVVGLAVGMGFSKTLAAVHRLAPDDRQAQVLASYFVVTYSASMLPVVGMGLITQFASPIAADYTFACIVGLLALAALAARLLGTADEQTQPA